MKRQIILTVEDRKLSFLLELLHNFDFVEIQTTEDSIEDIRNNLQQGLQEVKQLKQGKGTSRPAQDLLNEL